MLVNCFIFEKLRSNDTCFRHRTPHVDFGRIHSSFDGNVRIIWCPNSTIMFVYNSRKVEGRFIGEENFTVVLLIFKILIEQLLSAVHHVRLKSNNIAHYLMCLTLGNVCFSGSVSHSVHWHCDQSFFNFVNFIFKYCCWSPRRFNIFN